MDILFCDICNESVPEFHVQRGLAVKRGVRVVCASCEAAMGSAMGGGAGVGGQVALAGVASASAHSAASGAADARQDHGRSEAARHEAARHDSHRRAATAPGPVGVASAIGLVALTIAAAGVWATLQRTEQVERTLRGEIAGLAGELDSTRRARALGAAELGAQIEGVRGEARGIAASLDDSVTRSAAGFGAELATARERELGLRRDIEGLSARAEQVAAETRQALGEAKSSIAARDVDLRMLGDRLIAMEENLRTVGVRVAAGGAPAAAPAVAAPVAPTAPSWERFLPDLASDDEGLRVDAVIELGNARDPAALPHILPRLKDANLWVRMVAAEALGKLGSASAIPALIDALEDERTAVREQALFALQALTRETLQFDANASVAERAKRVRDWREWWRTSRVRLLGG